MIPKFAPDPSRELRRTSESGHQRQQGIPMPDTPSETPELRLERDGDIGFVIASNPARMNAFTAGMWKAVPEVIAGAVADPGIRVIVLRGAGTRAFSAGADISEFDSARAGDAATAYDALNDAAFRALSGCAKPTIAMIHGFCLGGGLAIALCADIRLSDDVAEFAIPAAKLGLGYNARWVRPLLAAVPPAKAKEMLFTGRRFKVAEALAMGLVNTVVPSGELEAKTRALAGDIAANAPLTVRAAKRTIDELVRNPQTPDLASLDAAVGACFDSEDYAEGRLAFKEKRKPRFQGR
jgi:enoyl-CoA hydratase